jgi:hypothetical protein
MEHKLVIVASTVIEGTKAQYRYPVSSRVWASLDDMERESVRDIARRGLAAEIAKILDIACTEMPLEFSPAERGATVKDQRCEPGACIARNTFERENGLPLTDADSAQVSCFHCGHPVCLFCHTEPMLNQLDHCTTCP